jgi:hypothetical protein
MQSKWAFGYSHTTHKSALLQCNLLSFATLTLLDVHRLVSAFLGVRFPMALALNKYDMPSSTKHVAAIQAALPLHGAHVGVPLSARSEMNFMRFHLKQHQRHQEQSARSSNHAEAKDDNNNNKSNRDDEKKIPMGTWRCLQSALSLREPVLVFPVSDMTTYQPLAGMINYATGDTSLPSAGMIACLLAASGSAPSLWDANQRIYTSPAAGGSMKGSSSNTKSSSSILRDVIMMKPGSTVEDVFLSLKRLGALGGEFVRAEGAGEMGEKSKPIPKDKKVDRTCRILKIMTNKRTQWQQNH